MRGALGGLLGGLLLPWVVLLLWPALPARIEAPRSFCFVGSEAGTGSPMLLRGGGPVHEVLAGSARHAVPAPVSCHTGSIEALRAQARDDGRIEDVTLGVYPGGHVVLGLALDDLGRNETYLYRCSGGRAHPLLSWSFGLIFLPGFGAAALLLLGILGALLGLGLARSRKKRV